MNFLYVSPLEYRYEEGSVLNDVLRVYDFGDYFELRYFPLLLKSGYEKKLHFRDTYASDEYYFFDPSEGIKKETTDRDVGPGSLKSRFVVSRAKKTVYELEKMEVCKMQVVGVRELSFVTLEDVVRMISGYFCLLQDDPVLSDLIRRLLDRLEELDPSPSSSVDIEESFVVFVGD